MGNILTIDARMINASGIGTYIKQVLPFIINTLNSYRFNILGNISELKKFQFFNRPNVNLINFNSSIYSIQEQVKLIKIIPKNTSLYWSPHYNIPVFYSGKLLVTVHDLNHLAITQTGFDWLKKKYAKYFFKKILQKAGRIITVSSFSKSEYIKYLGLKINYQKIAVVHNGLAIKEVVGDKNPHLKPYLLTVGNIKPHKNLVRLLDAFEKIMDSIPHQLLIVGKKSGFIGSDDNFIRKVDKFDQRVIITGFLSEKELQNYYSYADVFVFPSIYEGFGFPPLESMAAGTPVVASNAASIPEVCGDAALYFDPYDIDDMADKILQMIKNDELKKEYKNRGIEQVKKYSWNKTAEQTINVIQEILND